MNKFLAILGILFIPALSHGKLIGQTKADFEATHGQPIKLEALAPEIRFSVNLSEARTSRSSRAGRFPTTELTV